MLRDRLSANSRFTIRTRQESPRCSVRMQLGLPRVKPVTNTQVRHCNTACRNAGQHAQGGVHLAAGQAQARRSCAGSGSEGALERVGGGRQADEPPAPPRHRPRHRAAGGHQDAAHLGDRGGVRVHLQLGARLAAGAWPCACVLAFLREEALSPRSALDAAAAISASRCRAGRSHRT